MKLIQKAALLYFRLKLRFLEIVSLKLAAAEAFALLCTPYTRKKAYTLPPVFEEGARQSFQFQGHQIKGYEWQPKQPNQHTILICHGFDSASYKFARYVQPLLDQGFRVLAFDAPAHGLSTGKTINVLLYRNFILQVVSTFGPVHGIIAHSFGGIAAALAAEKMPPQMLQRLVLIAPATETWRSIQDFCKVLHVSKRLQTAIEELIISIGGQPVSWYSAARAVQAVPVPTLWLHDRHDDITPYTDMEHLQTLQLSHLHFAITQGLGHSLYNDDKVAHDILLFMGKMLRK